MSGKKHVFKMVPGQQFSCGSSEYEVYSNIKNPQSMKKVKLTPLSEEDNNLELSIRLCNSFLQNGVMYCVEEKQNRYVHRGTPGYSENSNSFAYDNDRLVKLSLNWGIGDKTGYHNFVGEELKYKYLTWEESGLGDDKYYFSDKEGNIIDSPDNKILQYSMPHHDTAKLIEDITSSKIPKSVLISSEFAKTFFKNLTGNQLETLADILNNEKLQILAKSLTNKQLQVLAENLTDEQFRALVDHLTNHQLQALTYTLDSKKLGIIVPLLNENQVTNLVKDFNLDQVRQIFPHLKMDQFEMMIKTMKHDQFVELIKNSNEKMINTILDEALKSKLPILVKTLEEDTLHDLINKLDHEKLAIVARDLTDPNKIQMVIKSLVDKPEKLQAFAHNMSREQFKELLDNVDAEELKDIIHKLPHEKVISVIGDLSSKDQSKAIIDAFQEKFDEQNEKQKEILELIKKLGDSTDKPEWEGPLQNANAELMVMEEYFQTGYEVLLS
ncbi:magnesium transporter [Wolbachia endosymbiont (group B) of Melanostoma mellinum]|uniref:MgtE intracellular N domain protein n=1 Tax=Wolbachia endosymbiont (group B) of Melanostoma mellinum TaxID=2954030 RepID=UPI00222F5972|nr:MgtE intracellular N domain protein [Wolbachia endosymbiont (group B) of Melanostoma mellinum]